MNGLHGRRGGQARRPVDRSIIVIIGCYDLGREVYSRGRQGRRRELGISMMFRSFLILVPLVLFKILADATYIRFQFQGHEIYKVNFTKRISK